MSPLDRWLQNNGDNATQARARVMYIIYLCILMCFCITPCVLYLRMYLWQRQRTRQLRELEQAGLMAAIQQTMNSVNREPESAEVRAERRARILQLLEPVRMTLEAEHFREALNDDHVLAVEQPLQEVDEETGNKTIKKSITSPLDVTLQSDDVSETEAEEEDDAVQIQVPLPGLVVVQPNSADGLPVATARTDGTRWVSGHCTICLSRYRIGIDVVWSSNPNCEHVFHKECMKNWLLKQREVCGPLCPCCRRDFVVDPYDVLQEEGMEDNGEEEKVSEPPRPVSSSITGENNDWDVMFDLSEVELPNYQDDRV